MSSVLTARGVPGGTVANTFEDAYLDPGCSISSSFVCDVCTKNVSFQIKSVRKKHKKNTQIFMGKRKYKENKN